MLTCNLVYQTDRAASGCPGAAFLLPGGCLMTNPRRKNGHRRDQVTAWLKAQGRPCWICQAFGRPATIDYSLPSRHPWSFEVDELVPVSKGGSPYDKNNVDAAHRRCNQWRGNKSVAQVLAIARASRTKATPEARGAASADWL